jgi:dolichol-phosphate mannosyltransferase
MSRPGRPSTVLFIPTYDEEGRIETVLARLTEVKHLVDEVVIVDDGSTDGTLREIAAAPVRCTVLRHETRRGLGEGFRTAYRHLLPRGHEVFAVFAGNGKDDPRDLPRVLGPILEGRADYVQGSRYNPAGGVSEGLPTHRNLAIRVFTTSISLLYGKKLTDCSNGYRAYRTALLKDPRVDWSAAWLGRSYQIEIYLLLKAMMLGYRVTEVPVSKIYPKDAKPYSKARAIDWWNMLKPVVWCLFRLDRMARMSQDHAAVATLEQAGGNSSGARLP